MELLFANCVILLYNRAIQLNPKDTIPYNNRGYAKNKLGNYRGAIQDLDPAIQLYPGFAAAYFWRGVTSLKLGDRYSAKTDLLKAKELYQSRGDTESVATVESWLTDL
ncbi:tetratricopeptide repeat protein [Gloeomargarita lithophora]|uniref:tetratricopeptide repeat protein n=1 Tax=Gloeomargarita lithophora TaxID=1188228 RepID=UPI0008F8D36F